MAQPAPVTPRKPFFKVHQRPVDLTLALSDPNKRANIQRLKDAQVYVRTGSIRPEKGVGDVDIFTLEDDGFHDAHALLDRLAPVLRKETDTVLVSGLSGDTKHIVFRVLLGSLRTATETFFSRIDGHWSRRLTSLVSFDHTLQLPNGTSLYWSALSSGTDGLEATGPLPNGMVLPKFAPPQPGTACASRLSWHAALASMPEGTIVSFGPACEAKGVEGQLLMESWPRGTDVSTVTELPGSMNTGFVPADTKFRVLAGDDAWLGTVLIKLDNTRIPYVTHFDGKSWTEVSPTSKPSFVFDFLDERAGGVLVLTEETAYRRDRSTGIWTEFAAPPRPQRGDFGSAFEKGPGGSYLTYEGKLYFLADGATEWDELVPPAELGVGPILDFGWTAKGKLYVTSFNAVYLEGRVSKVVDVGALEAGREKARSPSRAVGRSGSRE